MVGGDGREGEDGQPGNLGGCQIETACTLYMESGRAVNEFRGDCYESHLDDGESRSPHDEHQDLSEEKI